MIELLGCVAGLLTTISFLPQVIKVWKSRSTRDISLVMFVMFCLGTGLWTTYGVLNDMISVILANAVTMVLAFYILVMKVRHG